MSNPNKKNKARRVVRVGIAAVFVGASLMAQPANAAADTVYAVLQGQSNAVFLNDSYAGGHWWATFAPMVKQLTGIPNVEAKADTYDSAQYNRAVGWTLNSGVPTYAFGNADLSLYANNPNDASAWPLGGMGVGIRDYFANRFSSTPANTPVALFRFHSENDSTKSGTEAQRYEVANRRFVSLIRGATNLPNARIPVFYGSPIYGQNVTDEGLSAIRSAWLNDINNALFEAHWMFGANNDTSDMNGDNSHADAAGLQQMAARMSFAFSRWLYDKGYAVNNLSSLPKLGARINRFDRVAGAANQIDVKVVHDAGTDLVIPANANLSGFSIYDPGSSTGMSPTSVTKINATTLRLTLPNNLSNNSGITLDYLKGTWFYGPNSLITDNYHTLTKPGYIQAAINNSYPNFKMPIRRLAKPITIGVTDAPGLDDAPANASSTPTPTPTPTPGANLLSNPGFEAQQFETQTPSSWSEAQYDANWNVVAANASYSENRGGANSGNYHGSHWSSGAYRVYTSQTLTGLANGNYTLRARARSGGGQNACYLEAKDFGGAARTQNLPVSSTYQLLSITSISVTNGQCTVGIWSDANAGNWSNFDDFELFRQ